MKRVYLRRSARKVVLCDAHKFGRMSLVQVARLGEFDALVTDQEPPPDLRAALDSAGVEVRVAPEPPAGPR
jgi:DeoR family glycerol-3-phosphate regulon repressor